MRTKVNLDTQRRIVKFIDIVSALPGTILLEGRDGNTFCRINARSVIGALYSMIWTEVWCIADHDIRSQIKEFIVDDNINVK